MKRSYLQQQIGDVIGDLEKPLSFTDKEWQIVLSHVRDGKTVNAIAADMDISKHRVQRCLSWTRRFYSRTAEQRDQFERESLRLIDRSRKRGQVRTAIASIVEGQSGDDLAETVEMLTTEVNELKRQVREQHRRDHPDIAASAVYLPHMVLGDNTMGLEFRFHNNPTRKGRVVRGMVQRTIQDDDGNDREVIVWSTAT